MGGRRRRRRGAAAGAALALGALLAGCDAQTASPGGVAARPEATTDPQEGAVLVDDALYDLSTVDQVVTGSLGEAQPVKGGQYVLAELTSPALTRPTPVLLHRSWQARPGVSATFGTVPEPDEAVDVLGLPDGTLRVHLASPDLGPGVAADEPGRIWAAYRGAMPSVSDVELARAIVAGAKAHRAEQPAIGSASGSAGGSTEGSTAGRAMAAALLRAFGATTTSAPPTTSASGPSVLPDGMIEAAPAGTVSGRIVLLLPPTQTYRWVAVRFPGDRFTVPTNVLPGGIVDVLTAVPLGQAGEVVTWATEEPELDQATPISTVPALTAPQSVIRVVPQGRSVITDQGDVTELGDVTTG